MTVFSFDRPEYRYVPSTVLNSACPIIHAGTQNPLCCPAFEILVVRAPETTKKVAGQPKILICCPTDTCDNHLFFLNSNTGATYQ